MKLLRVTKLVEPLVAFQLVIGEDNCDITLLLDRRRSWSRGDVLLAYGLSSVDSHGDGSGREMDLWTNVLAWVLYIVLTASR